MYTAIVVEKNKLTSYKHPNADNLTVVQVDGNDCITSTDNWNTHKWFLYFPSGGQFSEEFVIANNLLKSQGKGGYLSDDRRIKAINLRGMKSFGLLMNTSCLDYIRYSNGVLPSEDNLKHGHEFTSWNGNSICNKFINQELEQRERNKENNKSVSFWTKLKRRILSKFDFFQLNKKYGSGSTKYFPTHHDTKKYERMFEWLKELFENESDVKIYLSEKVHGTSFRMGFVESEQAEDSPFLSKLRRFMQSKFGIYLKSYEYLNGSKSVILWPKRSEEFRQKAFELLKPHLKPGEMLFGELAGYSGAKIIQKQGVHKDNKDAKLLCPATGSTMAYSYGCNPGEMLCLIYRITQNGKDLCYENLCARVDSLSILTAGNKEGIFVEAPWELCDHYTTIDEKTLNEHYGKRVSFYDDKHIMEGVAIRVEKNGEYLTTLKWISPTYRFISDGEPDVEDVQ